MDDDVSELKDYYGKNHDELQMPMDLMFTSLKPLKADVFRKHIDAVYSSGEWPVWVMSNHDIRRAYSRFADGKHDDDIAKVMAAMYLLLRARRSCTTGKRSAWLTTIRLAKKM